MAAGFQDIDPLVATEGHPKVRFFTYFFKVLALLIYLFCLWFSSQVVLAFVLCVILLAVDFYVVKNISGRLLVGLRWWNEVHEDGSNVWLFEAKPNPVIHPQDSLVFWTSMYASFAVWSFFMIGVFFSFRFQWMLVVVVALTLNLANIIGYYKCRKDAKKNLQSFIAQML